MWVRLAMAVDGKKKKRYKDLTTNDDKFMRISPPLPLSLSLSQVQPTKTRVEEAHDGTCAHLYTHIYTRAYEIIVQQRFSG